MEPEDWEAAHPRRQKEVPLLMAEFVNVMVGEKKAPKIKVHQAADMMEFFALEFLSGYENEELLEGLESFPAFVGDWFLRKCMWSDVKSVKENIAAFLLFLEYLEISGKVELSRAKNLRKWIAEEEELWCARAFAYNDPELEWGDYNNECGMWDDEFILRHVKGGNPTRTKEGELEINLLLSERARKFLGLKPAELTKLKDWGIEWGAQSRHWSSWWRCEDFIGIEGSETRVMLVTNDRTNLSFLIPAEPGGFDSLTLGLRKKLVTCLMKENIAVPTDLKLAIRLLSGAAQSLTGAMNGQLSYLSAVIENQGVESVKILEERLLIHVSLKLPETFPQDALKKMCADDPPLLGESGPENAAPFLN